MQQYKNSASEEKKPHAPNLIDIMEFSYKDTNFMLTAY